MHPSQSSIRADRRAYTLVEVIFVLLILAILWGIAAPRYAYSMSRYRAEAAARRLGADLALARSTAQQTSTNVVVTFNTATNAYSMSGVQSMSKTSTTYSVSFASSPYRSSFATVPFTNNQLTFNQYGAADQSGQIVVQSGGVQHTVTVEATTGKAVVQ